MNVLIFNKIKAKSKTRWHQEGSVYQIFIDSPQFDEIDDGLEDGYSDIAVAGYDHEGLGIGITTWSDVAEISSEVADEKDCH